MKKVERLIKEIPTSLEIYEMYEIGIIDDDTKENLMNTCTSKEIEYLDNYFLSDELYAISENVIYHADISELFDLIVLKDLSYIGKVDGVPAIIRTDDNAIFKLYDDKTLTELVWC